MQAVYVDWAAMIIKIKKGGHGNLVRVSRRLGVKQSTMQRWENGSEPSHSRGELFKCWFRREYSYIPYRRTL